MSGSKKVLKVSLPAPHVVEVKNGVLYVTGLDGKPATAEVRYDDIKVGDSIVLVMDRLFVIYEMTHIVSASDVSNGKVTILLDNEDLTDDPGLDRVNLFYRVNLSPRSEVLLFQLTY
ncbi:hypothetical protein SAMN05216598_0168 [Pseudomonas asplenii]|uniref:Uncharacterized protein n=1 Tax=Pseudomonas asplenii TaxID=53407 RepID=A0A1H1NJ85_9PSED|nr:hypothetical protein [Pseudomonas asplenii]SDR99131.1 hypothetical protein SAMN05216598_0168 [Pseudomonas asplenii]